MKRSIAPVIYLLVSLFPQAVSAQAQDEETTVFRANAAEVGFAGRVQMQVNTSSSDNAAPTQMFLRRVRLSVAVRINEIVSGRIQPEFAGEQIQLADTHIRLSFTPAFNLIAGRGQRPFAAMEQTSTTMIVPIERGMAIRGVQDLDFFTVLSSLGYSNRDTGIQIMGAPEAAPLGLSYTVGVFGGPLQGQVGNEWTQQFIGRLAVQPLPETTIGVAVSQRHFALALPDEGYEIDAGRALVADLEYGGDAPDPGPDFMVEVVRGDFDPFTASRFSGLNSWLSYRVPREGDITIVEPLIRFSHVAIDRPAGLGPSGGTLITPGLNIYLGGLSRLMLNYDFWRSEHNEHEGALRGQFQLAF